MKKVYVFYIILSVVGLVLSYKLYYIQIVEEKYKLKGDHTSIQAIKQYPNRGYIYDRNNRLIVSNQALYNLTVVPSQIGSFDTLLLCSIVNSSKEEIKKSLEKINTQRPQYKESLFKKELNRQEIAYFREVSYRFPGFYVERKTIREYPVPSAPHAFGYIGEVSKQFLKENKKYSLGEYVGTAGIEKSYEHYLKGKRGVQFYRKDVLNTLVGSYKNGKFDTLPEAGKDLMATLDIELQEYGERLMKNKRGGIVAIEPKTGELLSLISAPNYDPNDLVGKKRNKNYVRLLNDTLSNPLFDRSLMGAYPPGSTFKIITGLIGKELGVITDSTRFTCRGGFRAGRKLLKCHCRTHWPIDLYTAIYKSCNNYFSNVYIKILTQPGNTLYSNQNTWAEYVRSFGLGNYLDNDLPVGNSGLVPKGDLYDRWYGKDKWNSITIISNAIGQGELLTTPIQLANVTAIIANKGWYYTPHIIKKIGGEKIKSKQFLKKKYSKVHPKHFQKFIDAMHEVTLHGTARNAKIPGIEMCAKTGTAENAHGQDHSIVIAFAPKDNPKIALSVFIENGYWGSRWAAPIASLMIEKYLNDSISGSKRKKIEETMMQGSIMDQYKKQFLKRIDKYGWEYIKDNKSKDSLLISDGTKEFLVKY